MVKALLLAFMPMALCVAGCEKPGRVNSVHSNNEACELIKTAVIEARVYREDVIAGCGDVVESELFPNYYVLRLDAHCNEDICGSVLLGWYAVESKTGRVFNLDITEGTLSDELTPTN